MNAFPKGFHPADMDGSGRPMLSAEQVDALDDLRWDAADAVASNLHAMGESADLVLAVADALPLMNWLAGQEVPRHVLQEFRELAEKVESVAKSVDEYVEGAS